MKSPGARIHVQKLELAVARIDPPIDLRLSGTRDDELLLSDAELNRVREQRASFPARSSLDVATTILGEALASR